MRLVVALFAVLSSFLCHAQPFPSKPLRIVVPFPAGGTTDIVARLVGQRMSETMGAAPLKQELIAGRVNLGGDQLSSSFGDIKAGKLKALATSASRRIPELPEVPTVRELGYPILETDGWNGFFAPAKTPREVVERLNREVASAVRNPEVSKRLRDMAAEPVGSSPAEQEAILKRQMDQFRPVIREIKID